MGDMLSQAEIDALLNGTALPGSDTSDRTETDEDLTPQEIDALGEIGNISMGASATALFTLLGQKVMITTPMVTVTTWEQMSKEYDLPFVAVKVEYTHGLNGSNLLILKEDDVKVITDLMMGGEGNKTEGELTDLHLSAISEAMNQMVGSSATSMSTMFSKRIDISPPKAFVMDFNSGHSYFEFDGSQKIVKIAFKMVVGNLIDSEIMQLIPVSFAKSLVDNLLNVDMGNSYDKSDRTQLPSQQQSPAPGQQSNHQQEKRHDQQVDYGYNHDKNQDDPVQPHQDPYRSRGTINVQPASFQSFDESRVSFDRNNINLIMDVPLQVTVELGRTHKMIKDILEFGPGSIIELDKLAGEPVDLLVNGKPIAKGEVVVIDESFGVRITDIIHPSKRL